MIHGEDVLRVVAADSGAAILNDRFEPLSVVAAVAALVEPPYREASLHLAEPIFANVKKGYLLIVHELELCQKLLKETTADVVHLDMSLGGISLEEFSVVGISRLRISSKARGQVLKILPKIRKIAADIKRVYGIEVLALGKGSIPVRIAELTSGAYAVLYSAEKAIKEKRKLRLGLPAKCQAKILKDCVALQSLVPAEQEVVSHARDDKGILEKVQTVEMLNPCARGFRLLEITPKV
ncbi:MAG: hypothetical protein AOA66_0220 [Candidatus Bathyarchaeota archaeon BA2]|nr:MAG: hypothetical protein AOA66_0220 [Candidatus Bathyarchaeota archaeon BA2]